MIVFDQDQDQYKGIIYFVFCLYIHLYFIMFLFIYFVYSNHQGQSGPSEGITCNQLALHQGLALKAIATKYPK